MNAAHRGALLSGGWTRGGTSEVVRRAHPASGAQWNVQVVKGKVNGKCLWNACKALSLGLLLMVLGAAMATIGYYADQLSVAQEIRGNHTVAVKNESRGFHLNNLSYAGPIVMGVGGFIVVAACVMTFEARDSAAKVVPARFKMSSTGQPPGACSHSVAIRSGHGSLRTAGSQTATNAATSTHLHGNLYGHHHHPSDRHSLTQSFVQFSRGLTLDSKNFSHHKGGHQGASPSGTRSSSLKVPQGSINRSPSAPDLVLDIRCSKETNAHDFIQKSPVGTATGHSRKTFVACALLNPGMLQRQALSVDEANYRSNDSLPHGGDSQGSMAMDLHLEAVTLKIRDKRRNPLKRQRKVEEEEHKQDCARRNNSHFQSWSPRLSAGHLIREPVQYVTSQHKNRRSSNASDCTYRSRSRRRKSNGCHHARGKLERAISSDSRLTGAIPKCYHSHEPSRNNSTEHDHHQGSTSESDVRKSHQVMVHFSPTTDVL
ncbi:uncharacterized protein [Euwallacea fornicatus]|uniref:uncharacterized protein n=1 Tax=Euwallacea fornicatus TaxID=995702 RepID=UPI00339074C3